MERSSFSESSRGLLAAKNLRQAAAGTYGNRDRAQRFKTVLNERIAGNNLSRFVVLGNFSSLNATQSRHYSATVSSWYTTGPLRTLRIDSAIPVAPATARSPQDAHEPRGVAKIFVETCQRWDLDSNDQLTLLGFDRGYSFGRHVLQGRVRTLSRDARDRAGYVIAISVGLSILYQDNIAAENQWLRRKRNALGEGSPLDRMLGGDMMALIAVNGMVERDRGL